MEKNETPPTPPPAPMSRVLCQREPPCSYQSPVKFDVIDPETTLALKSGAGEAARQAAHTYDARLGIVKA